MTTLIVRKIKGLIFEFGMEVLDSNMRWMS